MTTLITGGMGVIGSFATLRYLAEGERPIVVSRSVDRTVLGAAADEVEHVAGDISDIEFLRDVMTRGKVDTVLHVAGLTGFGTSSAPYDSVRINVLGTANLLELSQELGVKRFVYTSAKGIYGSVEGPEGYPDYVPLTEDRQPAPYRLYDHEKVMCERLGNQYKEKYGLDFAALRFSTTYGPGKTSRHGPMSVTSAVVEKPFAGERFVLDQGGDQFDDFIYNKDAGEALFLAATAPVLTHTAYNVGFGAGRRFGEFGEIVKGLVPGADVSIGPGGNFLGMGASYYFVYDCSRAEADFGYRPRFDLESGIADYIGILQRNKEEGTS